MIGFFLTITGITFRNVLEGIKPFLLPSNTSYGKENRVQFFPK